jgi:hypothetical protein
MKELGVGYYVLGHFDGVEEVFGVRWGFGSFVVVRTF